MAVVRWERESVKKGPLIDADARVVVVGWKYERLPYRVNGNVAGRHVRRWVSMAPWWFFPANCKRVVLARVLSFHLSEGV